MLEEDYRVLAIIDKNINMAVPYWLMSSYLYYYQDKTAISDYTFDEIGRTLKDNWDKIEHFNKHLINKDSTFTGYYIIPTNRIHNASKLWCEQLREKGVDI